MRIGELEAGMECYVYGSRLALVTEVVRANRKEGIPYSYAQVTIQETGESRRMMAGSITSLEQVQENQRRADQRNREIERIVRELGKYLPSVTGKHYYGEAGILLDLDERDCLRILECYGVNLPSGKRLPSHYDLEDLGERLEAKRRAVLLAQLVRRTVGEGWCSKWHFPQEWGTREPASMRLFLMDDAIQEMLEKLSGKAQTGSALADLLGV